MINLRLPEQQQNAVLALVRQLEGDALEDFRVKLENGAFRMGAQFRVTYRGTPFDVALGREDCRNLAKAIEDAQESCELKDLVESKQTINPLDAHMKRVEESVEG